MINDQDLITRVIANKDSHAFTQLVKKYQQNIRQFLRRITAGDWALADDLAQDTFLLAYQNLATFRGEANFTTWLHRIAYNRFLKSRQKAYVSKETGEIDLNQFEYKSDVEKDVLVEQLMKGLESNERICLTLSVSAGMSHQEIVNITDMPLGTVKSHINRGKQKMMEMVNQPSQLQREVV